MLRQTAMLGKESKASAHEKNQTEQTSPQSCEDKITRLSIHLTNRKFCGRITDDMSCRVISQDLWLPHDCLPQWRCCCILWFGNFQDKDRRFVVPKSKAINTCWYFIPPECLGLIQNSWAYIATKKPVLGIFHWNSYGDNSCNLPGFCEMFNTQGQTLCWGTNHPAGCWDKWRFIDQWTMNKFYNEFYSFIFDAREEDTLIRLCLELCRSIYTLPA